MSFPQQDRPGAEGAAGREDFWGADELDELLADPSARGRLGQVLAAGGAPAEAGPQVGEDAARSAFRIAFPASPQRKPRSLSGMSRRVAVAALAGGLVVSGAVVAAAAGALPGAAQQTAKDLLAVVGVTVPGPSLPAALHPQSSPSAPVSVASPESATAACDSDPTGPGGKVSIGSDLSDLARCSASTGVGKGAAVSGAASDGKSRTGQHGQHGPPASSTIRIAKEKTHKPHPGKDPKPNTHKPGMDQPNPPGTPRAKADNAALQKAVAAELDNKAEIQEITAQFRTIHESFTT